MRWTLVARLVIAVAFIALSSAQAAEVVDRIAAVVNDEVITVRELDERVRMAMVLSQIKDGVEARKRVVPQVLRKMIDEHLIMQEAKRIKIAVNPKEVEENIHSVEKQNNIPAGALATELNRFGIPVATLEEQFTADITWQHLVMGLFQTTFKAGDEEVTERLNQIANHLGKPEYMVADILLLVENPAQEEQSRNLGERLIQQLREGAPFPVLAQQFSQSPSASNGGNMGWIYEGTIDDDLFDVVKSMTPGSVTKLLRSTDGYHILALINRRIAGTGIPGSESTVTFNKMVLPVPTKDAPPQNVLLSKAALLVRGVKNCDEFEAIGRRESATDMERTGPVKLSTLPQEISNQLVNVPQGEISAPVVDPHGISLMMMCRREDKAAPLPSADNVRRQIEDERMSMVGRRYMRELHRTAFIDTRL